MTQHSCSISRSAFTARAGLSRLLYTGRLIGLSVGLFAGVLSGQLFAPVAITPAVAQDTPSLRDVLETGMGSAEESAAPTAAKPKPEVADDLDRGSPRGSVTGFLDKAHEQDYETASEYLDLRRVPEEIAEDASQLAKHLRVVLDRKLWIDVEGLSDHPDGFAGTEDGLPGYRELVGRIKGENRTYDILLHHTPRGDGAQVWKFASSTVADIPAMYEEFGYGLFGEILPPNLRDYELLGYGLEHWLALLVLPAACYILAAVFTGLIQYLLRHHHTTWTTQVARFVGGPLRLALTVLLFNAGRQRSALPLAVDTFLRALEDTLLIIALAWTVMRVADAAWETLREQLAAREQRTVIGVVGPARTTTRVLIIAAAILATLNSFGFNVTAVLAGLGVGGIAIALAAQRTFENLIGGITLFADQPVAVGDFCRFGDSVGTVEAIGLRSTRVRTLDRTLITVPNGEFASMHLENFAKRDKIRFNPRLGVRYETTPDQMRYILVEIRKLLYSHPKVEPDPCRIRFTGFGAFSLDLDIVTYIAETDYAKYLEVVEDLNLRIMDIVEAAGSGFAFPSQTLYVEQGDGIDMERGREAIEQVRKQREDGSLFLPSFPPEEIARLRGTIPYPPEGSPGVDSKSRRTGGQSQDED